MKCQKLQGKKGQLLKVYEHPINPFVKFAGTYKQVFETKWYTPQRESPKAKVSSKPKTWTYLSLSSIHTLDWGDKPHSLPLLALQANLYKIDIKNWLCGGVVNSLNSDKQHIFVILQ